MTDKTPDQLKSLIQGRFDKRKTLSANSIEHAEAIKKNRADRAVLSTEIKGLTKEYHFARKELVKSAKVAKAVERKAASEAKKALKSKVPVAA